MMASYSLGMHANLACRLYWTISKSQNLLVEKKCVLFQNPRDLCCIWPMGLLKILYKIFVSSTLIISWVYKWQGSLQVTAEEALFDS